MARCNFSRKTAFVEYIGKYSVLKQVEAVGSRKSAGPSPARAGNDKLNFCCPPLYPIISAKPAAGTFGEPVTYASSAARSSVLISPTTAQKKATVSQSASSPFLYSVCAFQSSSSISFAPQRISCRSPTVHVLRNCSANVLGANGSSPPSSSSSSSSGSTCRVSMKTPSPLRKASICGRIAGHHEKIDN
eukprot:SAG31_NODE_3209_length_4550_cov_4.465513_2_plen_189_part_00